MAAAPFFQAHVDILASIPKITSSRPIASQWCFLELASIAHGRCDNLVPTVASLHRVFSASKGTAAIATVRQPEPAASAMDDGLAWGYEKGSKVMPAATDRRRGARLQRSACRALLFLDWFGTCLTLVWNMFTVGLRVVWNQFKPRLEPVWLHLNQQCSEPI